jgi:hypothetical protein
MGRIKKQGSIGSISGAVNDVVVANWNGIEVVRSLPKQSSKPATTSQQEQQSKMAIAGKFAVAVKKVLTASYKSYAVRMSGYNACVRDVLNYAITGDSPNYRIDYSKVMVSRGRLHGESNEAAKAEAGQVTFTWAYEADPEIAANDKTILVVYCEALNQCLFTLKGADRSTGTASLAVARFKGQEVHTWLAFISADGKQTSTSKYTGVVTIT